MNKTVMIVDDSFFMRCHLKEILSSHGYNVIAEAGSGEEAIELYQATFPEVVFLDITLPGMNGITTLKEIKKIDSTAIVFMCSSIGHQINIDDALNSGAKDFIVKPFFDKLIPALNRIK